MENRSALVWGGDEPEEYLDTLRELGALQSPDGRFPVVRPADCHPNRHDYHGGLCDECYTEAQRTMYDDPA